MKYKYVILFWFLVVCPLCLVAQKKGRQPLPYIPPPVIDAKEGAMVLNDFRGMRLRGDFSFKFELAQMPLRKGKGDLIVYRGEMWGTWNDSGPLSRIHIDSIMRKSKSNPRHVRDTKTWVEEDGLRLLFQNGVEPVFWRCKENVQTLVGSSDVALADRSFEDPYRIVNAEQFEPLLPGFVITPFDLQMPFLYWERYDYEGRTQQGRRTYNYLMHPPNMLDKQMTKFAFVRFGIDAQFKIMTKASLIDEYGTTMKSFRIRGYQKVKDQYIIKELDFFDEIRRTKTRFTVYAAALEQSIPPEWFQEDSLDLIMANPVPLHVFQWLK